METSRFSLTFLWPFSVTLGVTVPLIYDYVPWWEPTTTQVRSTGVHTLTEHSKLICGSLPNLCTTIVRTLLPPALSSRLTPTGGTTHLWRDKERKKFNILHYFNFCAGSVWLSVVLENSEDRAESSLIHSWGLQKRCHLLHSNDVCQWYEKNGQEMRTKSGLAHGHSDLLPADKIA